MSLINHYPNQSAEDVLLDFSLNALNNRCSVVTVLINSTDHADVFFKSETAQQQIFAKVDKQLAYKIIRQCVELFARKPSKFCSRKIYDGFMISVQHENNEPLECYCVIVPGGNGVLTMSLNIKPLASHVELARKMDKNSEHLYH